jgi:hypothetical protein
MRYIKLCLRILRQILSNTSLLKVFTLLEAYQEATMTMLRGKLGKSMTMRNNPTHPPGICKVHRYAEEWIGLLIRGCVAQEPSLIVCLAISKKSPTLSLWGGGGPGQKE